METLKIPGSRLLMAVNTAEFFLSHRRHLAEGARAAGWDVWILCPPSPVVKQIQSLGFSVVEVELGRKSMNPFSELKTLWEMYKVIQKVNPEIYHGFTIKPVLYGTLVCRWLRVPQIINTITGLGFLFISQALFVQIIRLGVGFCYRLLFSASNVRIIFQNEDDQNYFVRSKWVTEEKSIVIKGTGVDIQKFCPIPEGNGIPVILFPARLLIDKGIQELIQAAQWLAQKGHQFTLELCGKEDPGNPSALPTSRIDELRTSRSYVRIRGHVEDMATAFQNAHIVCLPSYREGIPLALIEASACGRPIVTTDVPGCRAVVQNGREGFLVPEKNSELLALALEKLIVSKELRLQMGQMARSHALKEFAKEKVVQKNLTIYKAPGQNQELQFLSEISAKDRSAG